MSNRLRLTLSSGGLVTFFLCVRSASRCLMYSCVRLRVAIAGARQTFSSGVQVQRTVHLGESAAVLDECTAMVTRTMTIYALGRAASESVTLDPTD